MNKRGEESGTADLLIDIGRFLFTAVIVIILIYIGIQVWNLSQTKNKEVINSFATFADIVGEVSKNGKLQFSPLYITNKFGIIVFDNESLSSGNYEKPTECGLEYCLVVCKIGLLKSSKDCKDPIAYRKYGNQKFIFDKKEPVIIRGINGILIVQIEKDNQNAVLISLKKQTVAI
jgi:hypothetical protein